MLSLKDLLIFIDIICSFVSLGRRMLPLAALRHHSWDPKPSLFVYFIFLNFLKLYIIVLTVTIYYGFWLSYTKNLMTFCAPRICWNWACVISGIVIFEAIFFHGYFKLKFSLHLFLNQSHPFCFLCSRNLSKWT